jgi:hypothetical protein
LEYIAPVQKAAWVRKSLDYGTWGGEIRPEFEPKPGEIVARFAFFRFVCSDWLCQTTFRYRRIGGNQFSDNSFDC